MTTLQLTPLQRLQRRTYEILDGAVADSKSQACEIFIAVLVVLWLEVRPRSRQRLAGPKGLRVQPLRTG